MNRKSVHGAHNYRKITTSENDVTGHKPGERVFSYTSVTPLLKQIYDSA